MALLKKEQMKFVVDDLVALLFQKQNIEVTKSGQDFGVNISPEYDLPCKVDSLSMTQGDPNVSHYKVLGLDGDWTSSSTTGDFSLSFLVPTLDDNVLKLGWGEDAVKTLKTATIATGVESIIEGTNYKGFALTLNKKKVTGSVVLVNGTRTKLVIVRNATLWASIEKDANGDPFAVKFTGTMESKGDDILVLHKA